MTALGYIAGNWAEPFPDSPARGEVRLTLLPGSAPSTGSPLMVPNLPAALPLASGVLAPTPIAIGRYRVTFALVGAALPSFEVDVIAAHTEKSPLDLVLAASRSTAPPATAARPRPAPASTGPVTRMTLQVMGGDLAPLEFTTRGPLDDFGREALARRYANRYPRNYHRAFAAACRALADVDIDARGSITTRACAVDQSEMPDLAHLGDPMPSAIANDRQNSSRTYT